MHDALVQIATPDWEQEFKDLHSHITRWERTKYEYLYRLVKNAIEAEKNGEKDKAKYMLEFFEHEVFQGLTGLANILLDKEKLLK